MGRHRLHVSNANKKYSAGPPSLILLMLLMPCPAPAVWTVEAFLPSPQHAKMEQSARTKPLSSATMLHEKPGWLEDAMEGFSPKQEENETRLSKILPMEPGLAGFAVDANLGFCAILVADDKKSFFPVVVSSTDTDRLASAEALTMVQLAGGLDLGTAILPPDLLARIVADEQGEQDSRNLRRLVSLSQIDVLSNPAGGPSESKTEPTSSATEFPPEREEAIQQSLSKVWTAVKGLPGLATATEPQVLLALQTHADPNGKVDRDAFSRILDTIRQEVSPREQSQVLFRLVANVISGDSINKVIVETTNAVHALGLSLREKVETRVVLDDLLRERQVPAENILERFPAFRPMLELMEDAKIMDGFIPSMFQKAQIDNDMKE